MAPTGPLTLAFIGFNEAGQALGGGLIEAGAKRIVAYDLRFDGADSADLLARTRALGAEAATSLEDAVAKADVIVSTVTAGAAVAVARDVAGFIQEGQVFLDLNSISPTEKRAGAAVIESAGGTYVEGAVVSPVGPHGHKVPILFAGAAAGVLAERLKPFGMQIEVVGTEISTASAIKMCRSIVIKGLEALTVECLATARAYGVEDRVTASLDQVFADMNWRERSAYMLRRVRAHGARRAEEMRCAAETVRAIGIEPVMSEATAARQQSVADLGLDPAGAGDPDGGDLLDALVNAGMDDRLTRTKPRDIPA